MRPQLSERVALRLDRASSGACAPHTLIDWSHCRRGTCASRRRRKMHLTKRPSRSSCPDMISDGTSSGAAYTTSFVRALQTTARSSVLIRAPTYGRKAQETHTHTRTTTRLGVQAKTRSTATHTNRLPSRLQQHLLASPFPHQHIHACIWQLSTTPKIRAASGGALGQLRCFRPDVQFRRPPDGL